MTFKQWAEKYLFDHGLFEDQAKAVVEAAMADPANEPMKDRWNDDIDGYPPTMQNVLRASLHAAAYKWLDKNHPQHWTKSFFKSSAGLQGSTTMPVNKPPVPDENVEEKGAHMDVTERPDRFEPQ